MVAALDFLQLGALRFLSSAYCSLFFDTGNAGNNMYCRLMQLLYSMSNCTCNYIQKGVAEICWQYRYRTVGIQLKTTTILESNNREGLPTEHRQRSEAVIKLRPENTGGRSMPGLSFSLSL
jgi:hypothetical protein